MSESAARKYRKSETVGLMPGKRQSLTGCSVLGEGNGGGRVLRASGKTVKRGPFRRICVVLDVREIFIAVTSRGIDLDAVFVRLDLQDRCYPRSLR